MVPAIVGGSQGNRVFPLPTMRILVFGKIDCSMLIINMCGCRVVCRTTAPNSIDQSLCSVTCKLSAALRCHSVAALGGSLIGSRRRCCVRVRIKMFDYKECYWEAWQGSGRTAAELRWLPFSLPNHRYVVQCRWTGGPGWCIDRK